jgi:hypothetical protein
LRDWIDQVGIWYSEYACLLIEATLRGQSRWAGDIELVFISSDSGSQELSVINIDDQVRTLRQVYLSITAKVSNIQYD